MLSTRKKRLGLSADACVLVIEDSPAGIAAGKAAGCKVIGLATTHSIAQLRAVRPDWIVRISAASNSSATPRKSQGK